MTYPIGTIVRVIKAINEDQLWPDHASRIAPGTRGIVTGHKPYPGGVTNEVEIIDGGGRWTRLDDDEVRPE